MMYVVVHVAWSFGLKEGGEQLDIGLSLVPRLVLGHSRNGVNLVSQPPRIFGRVVIGGVLGQDQAQQESLRCACMVRYF